MPGATVKHKFEWQIFEWANTFGQMFTGESYTAFLMIFDNAGAVRRIFFGDRSRYFNHDLKNAITRSAPSWLFWDPFDLPEHGWLQWHNLNQQHLERVMGEYFDSDAFDGWEHPEWGKIFPASWSLMF